MIKILVTGTRPRIGKTTFICKLLNFFSGYAVIQVKEGAFFTSIIQEPKGGEANLLRKNGSIQVINIQADPKDVTDAMDQALILLPIQLEGIIIEGNSTCNNYQADIVIFLTDCPLCNPDPILEIKNILVVKLKSKGNTIEVEWKASIDVPVFDLDMGDIDEKEWKRFIANLNELLSSLKT